MQLKKISRVAASAILAITAFTTLQAQSPRFTLPDAHKVEHNGLLADQQNIKDQIKVKETQEYLDILFREEEEPEMDIYTEGWESGLVNPYKSSVVPDRKEINVSNFAMPTSGYITSPYGYRKRFRRMHKGVDLKVQIGDTIRAAFDGKVRLTKFEKRGYGYYVILRHGNELETVYGHLSKFLVKPDQYVKAGDPIALGGNTGRSTGPHLHFETRYMGYAINPMAIFDFENQTTHTDTYVFDKRTYQNARDYSPAGQRHLAASQKAPANAKASSKSSSKTKGSVRASKSYKVKKGDTLSKIAARNGVSVKELCRINGIKTSTKLTPGKSLKVK